MQPAYLSKKKHLHIVRAINKYGLTNFTIVILEFVHTNVPGLKLDLAENKWIALLNPEYNILKFAFSSLGFKHNEDTKTLISNMKKGVKLSIETKQKMSESKKGINNSFFGKTHTEKTKAQFKAIALN